MATTLQPLFKELLEISISSNSFEENKQRIKDELENKLQDFDKTSTSESQLELKSNIDLSIRLLYSELFKRTSKKDHQKIDLSFQLITYLIELGYSDAYLLVQLYEDLFDSKSIEETIQLFSFLESKADYFSQDAVIGTARTKNLLLKLCTELLKRLSRSTNPESCGRILIFLAYIFPLSDPSGLNAKSVHNVHENLDLTNLMEFEESNLSNTNGGESTTIDVNFYKQFWGLQTYFQNPQQMLVVSGTSTTLNKEKWQLFMDAVELVMSTFATHLSLDELASLPQNHYFTKYLTSSNLMKLQLKDSTFRRNILTQLLITFQFLEHTSSQKTPTLFSDAQRQQIQQLTTRAFKVLAQTQPSGPDFVEGLTLLLKRELNWLSWKRDGCKSFSKSAGEPIVIKKRKLKPSSARVVLGNYELSRLWNLSSNTEEALKSEVKMSLEEYVAPLKQEMIEQEEEAKKEAEKQKRIAARAATKAQEQEEKKKRIEGKKAANPDYKEEDDPEEEEGIDIDSDDLEDLDDPKPLLKDDQVYMWKTLRLVARNKMEGFNLITSTNKLIQYLRDPEANQERKHSSHNLNSSGNTTPKGSTSSPMSTSSSPTKTSTSAAATAALKDKDKEMTDVK